MEDGSGRAFADLHVHSSASFDSLSRPRDLVRAAALRGLTHVAITDHERLDGALRARDDAPAGLLVIVGEEVCTTAGDLIGLYLEHAVSPGLSPADASEAIHEQGGLVVLPHPFDRFRSSAGSSGPPAARAAALVELAQVADVVEAHNGRALGRANSLAAAFAAEHRLAAVASSDAHTVLEVGVSYTVLSGHPRNAAELLTALAGARLVTGRGSILVRAWTPFAKLVQRTRGNGRLTVSATEPAHHGATG